MIGILDYGIGNISSIANMLKKTGVEAIRVKSVEDLNIVSKIILPGVGAFDYGMKCLQSSGILDRLNERVLNEKLPTLGICLGMHLMCKTSEEGEMDGLGWIDASVRKFNFQGDIQALGLKIPHMGWNEVNVKKDNSFCDENSKQRFYFVHSYFVDCNKKEDILLTCEHGNTFVAGFQKGNIIGMQFHPEKSHRFGLELLKRFVNSNVEK